MSDGGFRPISAVRWLVLHHPACRVSIDSLVQEQYDQNIGYNCLVGDFGIGGKLSVSDLLPMNIVSNGAYGANYESYNVCVLKGSGNFEEESFSTRGSFFAFLVQVLVAKMRKLGWGKFQVGRIVGHDYIGKHVSSEYYVTACPGSNLVKAIPALRSAVASYLH